MKVSDLLVRSLAESGVELVFGIPSIHNIGFYNALRQQDAVRHILCRHESAATHMADGYARSGRGVGVVVTSTGPGAGYMVPALMEAWSCCSPVLALTSNIPSDRIGNDRGALHEIKAQDEIFKEITKARFCLRPGMDVAAMVDEAVSLALSGRPGPVYLEVPTDLWDVENTPGDSGRAETGAGPIPEENWRRVIQLLTEAKRPLIMGGLEAVRADIGGEIETLAGLLGAPVVTETMAKGLVPEDHPHVFGNATRKFVIKNNIQAADVTLVLGARLREVDFRRKGLKLNQLIHVDCDETWLGRNFEPEAVLAGDIKPIARELIDRLRKAGLVDHRALWAAEAHDRMRTELSEIQAACPEVEHLMAIRRAMPRDGILVADNTMLGYWSEYFYPSYCPGGLINAKGSTSIGFAFSAAVGFKLARPERPVAALIGDGGFLYGAQELATCRRHGIGFPVIVVNDGAYGIIDFLQNLNYQAGFETSLDNPDFQMLAGAFGAAASRVETPEELGEALRESLNTPEMHLIELRGRFPGPPFGRY